jgi:hypothetical protein
VYCCSTRVEPFILGLRRSLKTFSDPLGENLNELLEDSSNVGNGRLESTRCGRIRGVR